MQLACDRTFRELLVDCVPEEPQLALVRPFPRDDWLRVRPMEADGYVGDFRPPEKITVEPTSLWPAAAALPGEGGRASSVVAIADRTEELRSRSEAEAGPRLVGREIGEPKRGGLESLEKLAERAGEVVRRLGGPFEEGERRREPSSRNRVVAEAPELVRSENPAGRTEAEYDLDVPQLLPDRIRIRQRVPIRAAPPSRPSGTRSRSRRAANAKSWFSSSPVSPTR